MPEVASRSRPALFLPVNQGFSDRCIKVQIQLMQTEYKQCKKVLLDRYTLYLRSP